MRRPGSRPGEWSGRPRGVVVSVPGPSHSHRSPTETPPERGDVGPRTNAPLADWSSIDAPPVDATTRKPSSSIHPPTFCAHRASCSGVRWSSGWLAGSSRSGTITNHGPSCTAETASVGRRGIDVVRHRASLGVRVGRDGSEAGVPLRGGGAEDGQRPRLGVGHQAPEVQRGRDRRPEATSRETETLRATT